MLYIEWCKDHRKAKRTTSITACPLCLIEDNDRLQARVAELESIHEWMVEYYITHGRYPCPDRIREHFNIRQ